MLAATASPVKVDGRAEQCPCCGGPAAPDHQCDVVPEEVEELLGEKPSLPGEEPYVLEVECAREEHDQDPHTLWCCTIVPPNIDPRLPVPAPARVYHPNYKCIGKLMPDYSTASSSTYNLLVNGEMIPCECFAH